MYGTAQAQHRTFLHEQLCSRFKKLLIKVCGNCFAREQNSCHSVLEAKQLPRPLISDFKISSKVNACASECDIALRQYRIIHYLYNKIYIVNVHNHMIAKEELTFCGQRIIYKPQDIIILCPVY